MHGHWMECGLQRIGPVCGFRKTAGKRDFGTVFFHPRAPFDRRCSIFACTPFAIIISNIVSKLVHLLLKLWYSTLQLQYLPYLSSADEECSIFMGVPSHKMREVSLIFGNRRPKWEYYAKITQYLSKTLVRATSVWVGKTTRTEMTEKLNLEKRISETKNRYCTLRGTQYKKTARWMAAVRFPGTT